LSIFVLVNILLQTKKNKNQSLMTNRTLTALALRIAAIYIFITISDQFVSLFLNTYLTYSVVPVNETSVIAVDKFYQSGAILIIVNIILSLFFFFKAEWIAKKVIQSEKEIATDLNTKSITKIVLVLIGIIWLAKSLYILPDFVEYGMQLTSSLNGDESSNVTHFQVASYILRIVIALFFVFRVEKISNWILKRI
jgi:hypothetical protein